MTRRQSRELTAPIIGFLRQQGFHKALKSQDLIEYTTVGTPLTAEHFTGHSQGSAYGLASPPGRYHDDRLRPKTAIDGLFLTGSDIACSGVPGAFAGGVFCASVILNKNMAAALFKLDKKQYGASAR
jgi:all-trans-retinol 13,14-reductase